MGHLKGVAGFLLFITASFAADPVPIIHSYPGIWVNGVGNGFRKNIFELGVAGGGGIGMRAFGSQVRHDFWLADVGAGWIFTDVQCPGTFWQGNWELRTELF